MPIIFFVAALPPPIHGQSTISLALNRLFSEIPSSKLKTINTSPGSLSKNWKYHFLRVVSHLRACFLFLIYRILYAKKKIVVYTVYESGFGVFYNYLTCVICRFFGFHVYIHHHTSKHAKQHSRFFEILDKIIGARGVHIVLADEMAADLNSLYKLKSRVFVLPNLAVLDLDYLSTDRGFYPNAGICIGMLSNLTVSKGAMDFIRICEKLLDCGVQANIFLAGPVVEAPVRDAVDKFGIKYPNSLRLLGSLQTEQQKIDFFQSIDIFLFPTRYKYEAQPLVLLEALSSSAVCISNSIGYIRDVLGNDGFYIEQNIDAVCQLIGRFSTDRKFLSEASQAHKHRFCLLKSNSEQKLDALIDEISNI